MSRESREEYCARYGHRVCASGHLIQCMVCDKIVHETENVIEWAIGSIYGWMMRLVEPKTTCPPVD